MQSKTTHSLFINLSLAALAIYCLTIVRYAYNMPVGDDYDAILNFLNQYFETDWLSKLRLLFGQHNEHRILLTRLISVIDLSIFGSINFSHLIWLGAVGWVATVLAFWRFSNLNGVNFAQFAPVIILLTSFSHFDIMTSAMTSIQQYFQILFAILTIGYMVNNRPLTCLCFYTCAVFTGGGGIVLAPLIATYYALKRKWGHLFGSLGVSSLIFLLYFVVLPYSSPIKSKALDALIHPEQCIGYFLGFLGGWSNIPSIGLASIITGGSILLVFFTLGANRSRTQSPFFFWMSIYILMTAALTALNRYDLGLITSGDSRYSQYSLLFLSCIYLSFIATSKNKRSQFNILLIGTLISILIFCYWYAQALRPLEDRLYWLKNDLQVHPSWKDALSIRAESARLGVFSGK